MRFRSGGSFAAGLLVAAAVLWSFATTDVELSRLMSAGPRIADFLGRMFPPDPSVMQEIMTGSAETLRIAILGSLGAVILSIPSRRRAYRLTTAANMLMRWYRPRSIGRFGRFWP